MPNHHRENNHNRTHRIHIQKRYIRNSRHNSSVYRPSKRYASQHSRKQQGKSVLIPFKIHQEREKHTKGYY